MEQHSNIRKVEWSSREGEHGGKEGRGGPVFVVNVPASGGKAE